MPAPTITALPTPPSTSDPTNFDANADAFLAALPNFVTQTNALAAYLETTGIANAATLGGKTWASPDAIGTGTPAAATVTALTASGVVTLQNAVNSTGAFLLKNAAGTTLLNYDTTNQRLTLSDSANTFHLTLANGAGSAILGANSSGDLLVQDGGGATKATFAQAGGLAVTGPLSATGNITTDASSGSTKGYYITSNGGTSDWAIESIATTRVLSIGVVSGTPLVTLDRSGSLLLGATSGVISASERFTVSVATGGWRAASFKSIDAATPTIGLWNADTTGDNKFQDFWTDGGVVRGSIDYNRAGGVLRVNTSSDGELKNILGDAPRTRSLEILHDTRMRLYEWKHMPGVEQIGPIAQELQQVYGGAVSEGGVRLACVDGVLVSSYQPWAVDKTAFVNHLVIGWQDHDDRLARIEQQLGLAA